MDESIYTRIEGLLVRRGINKKELSRAIGVPYTTIMSAFKRNSSGLSPEVLGKIAEYLDTSIDYLVGNKNAFTDGQPLRKSYRIDEAGVIWAKTYNDILNFDAAALRTALERRHRILSDIVKKFDNMNELGQEKAHEFISDLSEIPKYRKSSRD